MNRILTDTLFTVVIMALLVACPGDCPGQPQESENPQLLRLEVKHVALDYATEIVETALAGDDSQVMGDARSSSLVIYGSADAIARAKDALAKIDVRPEPKPVAVTTVFPLRNMDVEQVAGTIGHLMEGPTCRIVADGATNSLVVAANEQGIEEIGRLVELLDRPATIEKKLASDEQSNECQIRLSWLVESSSFEDSNQQLLRKVRPSLKKLVEHLVAEGSATNIVTLTDVQILTGDGEFRNTSTRELGGWQVEMTVAGEASKTDSKFDLSLDLTFIANGQETGLESRFSAPVDHPVAFSVSDIAGIRSYLVVEVSVPDTSK